MTAHSALTPRPQDPRMDGIIKLAILAVGGIRKQVVVGPGDALVVRPLMRMTLSCDHRIVDGAVGAAFLKDLKDMMEDPVRTLY